MAWLLMTNAALLSISNAEAGDQMNAAFKLAPGPQRRTTIRRYNRQRQQNMSDPRPTPVTLRRKKAAASATRELLRTHMTANDGTDDGGGDDGRGREGLRVQVQRVRASVCECVCVSSGGGGEVDTRTIRTERPRLHRGSLHRLERIQDFCSGPNYASDSGKGGGRFNGVRMHRDNGGRPR